MTLLSQNCHTFIYKFNLCAASVRKKKAKPSSAANDNSFGSSAPLAWLAPLVCVASVSAASRGKLAGGKLGESAETEAAQTSGAELAKLAEQS